MKYLKMIGLAAVAVAALLAIAGTGTASATVFCHTTTSPCPEKWKAGTEPRFGVKPGTAGIWGDTSGAIAAKCPEGELRGTITSAGSATETVKISVPASGLTWKSVEGCIKTETLEGGTLEVHAIAGTDNGTVTVTGFKITISILGANCVYGFGVGQTLGTLTGNGSGTAVLDIKSNFVKKEGGISCPLDLNWAEEFTQEQPSGTGLYVLAS
ncbi:MAG TPA: hypothetical protein VFP17_04715 [Solirubrobacterales bacterium]|nr:hypothetical protein [Solirubrobacterales bacterium]